MRAHTIALAMLAVVATSGRAAAQEHTVAIQGIEMYYETHGQGPPLVLLHGFGGSGDVWKPYLADLARQYQVIVPDMRGHGRSTNPSRVFTHRQSALDVYALLDHLEIGQFKAIGFSSGGMTLVHMATQQPERVEAMILVGATIFFPEQARAIMRTRTDDSLTAQDLERLRQIHKRGDEQIRMLRAQFRGFKDSYDDMNFTPPFLATIKAKTLVVHGDRDAFFPVEIPVEMYRSIPNSYLWIVPNGTHVISKHPSAFTETALEFLRGDWDRK